MNKNRVINGGVTKQYFKLKKGARQGDPVPSLFVHIMSRKTFYGC